MEHNPENRKEKPVLFGDLGGNGNRTTSFSVGSFVLGLLAGIGVGTGCLILDFVLGFAFSWLQAPAFVLNTLLTSALLIWIAISLRRSARDRGFIRGMLIALSLTLILCLTCGASLLWNSRPRN